MRVFFISSNPSFGGGTTANLMIAQTLLGLGHKVFFNDEFLNVDSIHNLPIVHHKIHWRSKPKFKTIINEVMSYQPDVVIWGTAPMCVASWKEVLYFRYREIRQVVIFHSLSLFHGGIKAKTLDVATSVVAGFTNSLVFVSKYTKKSWMQMFCIRHSSAHKYVVYNPIFLLENNSVRIPHDKLNVAFVGRISIEKCPDDFCKLSKFNQYNFHLWGRGDHLPLYKAKYPNVLFHGEEKNTDAIYQDMDILIMTSKIENCPMVILEAKTRGIPTIAPKIGGIPEIVEDGMDGYLYEEFNVDIIGKLIEQVQSDYQSFSMQCKINAKQFGTNAIGEKWEIILHDILVTTNN